MRSQASSAARVFPPVLTYLVFIWYAPLLKRLPRRLWPIVCASTQVSTEASGVQRPACASLCRLIRHLAARPVASSEAGWVGGQVVARRAGRSDLRSVAQSNLFCDRRF